MIRRKWARDLRHEDYQREVEAKRELREKQEKLAEEEIQRLEEEEYWRITDATLDMLDEEQQR